MSARDMYAQARRKSLAVPCEILRVVTYTIDSGEAFYEGRIEIVRGNKTTESCIGIHTQSCLDELEDVIESAERDGFERIYVYGGAL